MKRSFSLLETILILFIFLLVASFFYSKSNINDLETVTKRLELYLKQTRYLSLIDSKHDETNPLWHKKRWTLKFFNCRNKEDGIYYSIYSDDNMTGHPSLNESLIDPLNRKRVYSTNSCKLSDKISKYIFLTKEYGIKSVELTCNKTSGIGQLSFGSDGNIYSKLSYKKNDSQKFKLEKRCVIKLTSHNNESRSIIIEPKTSYIYAKKK